MMSEVKPSSSSSPLKSSSMVVSPTQSLHDDGAASAEEPPKKKPNIGSGPSSAFNDNVAREIASSNGGGEDSRMIADEDDQEMVMQSPRFAPSKKVPIIIPSPRNNVPVSTLMFDIKTPRPTGSINVQNSSLSSPFAPSAFGRQQDQSSSKSNNSISSAAIDKPTSKSPESSPKRRLADSGIVRPIPTSIPSTPLFLQSLDNAFFNSSAFQFAENPSLQSMQGLSQPLKLTSRSPKRPREVVEFTPSAFLATPLRRTGQLSSNEKDSSSGFEPLPPAREQVMDIYSRYDFFRSQKDHTSAPESKSPPQMDMSSAPMMSTNSGILKRSNSVDSQNSEHSHGSSLSINDKKGKTSYSGLTDIDLSQSPYTNGVLYNTSLPKVPIPVFPQQQQVMMSEPNLSFSQSMPSYPDRPLPVSIGNSFAENSSASIVPLKNEFGAGSSCHQCKNRRDKQYLSYCSNADRKKRTKTQKNCRKKYCDQCLNKFYNEKPPVNRYLDTGTDWQCPACRNICTCAACKKRKSGVDDGNESS